MFMLVVRVDGNTNCAGSVMRTPASDPNNAVMLCRAERGAYDRQTGSCSVCKTKYTTYISNQGEIYWIMINFMF